METTIYYFTGTGNSLAAAKAITASLEHCILKSIAKAMQEKDFKVSTPKVGFIFPLYYVGIPKIVQKFIKQADLSETKYIFIGVTKGWPVVGGGHQPDKTYFEEEGQKVKRRFVYSTTHE